uniref:LAGLIDADG endonuclease n=1 Tax=Peronospora matthiolae TaxID=2874970 RepID=A0AAV1UAP1_9STRA
MNPHDRLSNLYLANFIDHGSNYCRVFLTKSKGVAALKFKHFSYNSNVSLNCKIHVLRMNGGGEYKNLDVFCKETGVSRQVREARK